MKDGGKGVKSAYKGLRSKLKDNQGPHPLENGLERGDKHRSAPNSPTGKRRTIAGFSAPVATYRKDAALALKSSAMQRLLFYYRLYQNLYRTTIKILHFDCNFASKQIRCFVIIIFGKTEN